MMTKMIETKNAGAKWIPLAGSCLEAVKWQTKHPGKLIRWEDSDGMCEGFFCPRTKRHIYHRITHAIAVQAPTEER